MTAREKCPSPVLLALGMVLAALLAAGSVAAQEPAQPAGRFEGAVAVTEVLVDVLVTDEAGNVILGLGPEDFVIEEEGRPVDLESVSFYSNRHLLGGLDLPGMERTADDAPLPPEDRYFVLLYHRPPTVDPRDAEHFLRLAEAGRRSFEWLVEDLVPNDHVAVVSFGRGLEIHHDFSLDRARLGKAVKRAAAGKAPEPRWTSRTETPRRGISLASLPRGEDLLEATPTLYDALRLLGESLGTVKGRKNIVLFGLDLPHYEGFEPDAEDPDLYPPMIRALNDNNVAVYTVALSRRTDQDRMRLLAEETGGEHAFSFRTFSEPLARIARENSGYYLLAYKSSHPAGESGYQPIEVRTRIPDLRVRARSGYLYGE